MPDEGGEPVALSEVLDGWATYPTWSPDGEQIAYSRGQSFFETSDICVMRADGEGMRTRERPLESLELEPSWSPDGQSLVPYRDTEEGPRIFITTLDGSEVEQLT